MLSRRENYANWIAFKFLSKFCIIPFDFNPQTEEIRKPSLWKRLIWNCYFSIYLVYVLHMAFTFCTLIHNTATYGTFNFNHFSIHVIYILGFFNMGIFAFNCKKWARVLSIVRNELLRKVQNKAHKSKIESKLSLQKLILIVSPVLFLIAFTFGSVVVFKDPTRPQLLFQLLSDDHKTPLNYFILGSIEYSVGAFCVGCFYFGINLQLLFFEYLHNELSYGIQSFTTSMRTGFVKKDDIQNAMRHCRHLQVLIQLFNRSNASAIFCSKLSCFAISIGGAFFFIQFVHVNPIVALFDAFVGLIRIVLYIVMYEKAFKIPQQMAEYKNRILIAAHPGVGVGVSGRRRNRWAQVVVRAKKRNALEISRVGW